MGPVERAEDFYSLVDCVVAPVTGGSGGKCKLSEAILAGRPVVTTSMGAAGYPPDLSRHFAVCDPDRLGPEILRRALAEFNADRAREDFERQLGWEAVIGRYASAVEELAEPSSASTSPSTISS